MEEEEPLYRLLKSKDIYAILDGDTKFGEYEDGTSTPIPISMPQLTKGDLCRISKELGLSEIDLSLSRWQHVENLITHCIKTDRCSEFLGYLFRKDQFLKKFSDVFPIKDKDSIDKAHKYFLKVIIGEINALLYYAGGELVRVGGHFVVKKIEEIRVQTPEIEDLDSSHIKDISERAGEDIKQGNYDSAITKSRSLIEAVFRCLVKQKGIEPKVQWTISQLYSQVKDLYKMHGGPELDKRINSLISGLETIVSAISEMRNRFGDAHGVETKKVSIKERHARLVLNSAITISEFFLSVGKNQNNQGDVPYKE